MAYTVTFYTFGKKTNSTGQPSGGDSYNCIVKAETGILEPVIKLNLPITTAPAYNYCYIPDFGRYYWIREWSYQERLWTAVCYVDVLATYKSNIGSASLYILRSAFAKNGYIADSLYPLSTKATISAATDGTYWWTIQPDVTGGVYIVGILGRIDSGQTAGGITYLCLGPSQFRSFTEELFKDDLSYYDGSNLGISASLAKMIFQPYEYIASVTWLPAEPTATSVNANGWHVGWWTYSQAVKVLSPAATLHFETQYSLADHPQKATRGEYCNTAPYTMRILRLPRVGAVVLDSSVLANISQITISLDVDPITGAGVYEIYGSGLLLDRIACQIGVSVHLSSTGDVSFGEAVSAASNMSQGIYNAAAAGGAGSSIIAASAAALSATDVLSPHISALSSQGGYLGLQGAAVPRLYNVFREIVDDDNTEHGRPLCVTGTISNYPGYNQVLNGDIAIAGATRAELDEIRSLLEGGFYYE